MRFLRSLRAFKRLGWQSLRFSSILALVFLLVPVRTSPTREALGGPTVTSGCATGSPSSGAYSVSICITSPPAGASLKGNATVTATVSASLSSARVRKVLFYLDGAYLLTDYSSAYTLLLPTQKWADGSHTISARATMRDGFITAAASRAVKFANGLASPLRNTATFKPTSGRPANGSPFVVAAAGDGASGELYAGKVAAMLKSVNPNLLLYLGDVYEKGSLTEFYNWYGLSGAYFSALRSITDPAVGNHEYLTPDAAGYFDYWNNVPPYYSFNANGWHFISLDFNSSFVSTAPRSAAI